MNFISQSYNHFWIITFDNESANKTLRKLSEWRITWNYLLLMCFGYMWRVCRMFKSLVSLCMLLVSLSLPGSASRIHRSEITFWSIHWVIVTGTSLDQSLYISYPYCQFKNNVTNLSILRVVDLDRQLILTKDNITVNIDTSVYYRIVNPKMAYYTV